MGCIWAFCCLFVCLFPHISELPDEAEITLATPQEKRVRSDVQRPEDLVRLYKDLSFVQPTSVIRVPEPLYRVTYKFPGGGEVGRGIEPARNGACMLCFLSCPRPEPLWHFPGSLVCRERASPLALGVQAFLLAMKLTGRRSQLSSLSLGMVGDDGARFKAM